MTKKMGLCSLLTWVISVLFVRMSIQYREKHSIKDRTVRRYPVENIMYVQGIDKSAIVEKNSSVVKLYDSKKGKVFRELCGHTGTVLSCEYIKSHKWFVTTSSDKTVGFWDQTYSLRRRLKTPNIQYCAKWAEENQMLFTGDNYGRITSWNIDNLHELYHIDSHQKAIMSLLPIKHLGLIVSASLDHSLHISDMVTGDLRTDLKGHRKGVLSVDYCSDYGILLSSGFERDVLGWNLFFNNPVARFVGHREAVVSVYNVPNTPQIVSADAGGNVRVWDVRTNKCVQNFTLDEPISAFGFNCDKDMLLLGSKKVRYFDRGPIPDPYLTSDYPCSGALYNPVYNNFATSYLKTVQIWQGSTGEFTCAYIDVTESDITAMCLGKVKRRLWVGDKDGDVRCILYSNGAFSKNADGFKSEITALKYLDSSSLLIGSEMSGFIKVFSDANEENSTLLHTVRGDLPTGLCLSGETGLMASVTLGGHKIRVWERVQFVVESDLETLQGDFLSVIFLKGCMAMACSNTKGFVEIWATAPARIKYKQLVSFPISLKETALAEEDLASLDSSVNQANSLCFDSHHFRLFAGDDEGYISCWDVSKVLKQANLVIQKSSDKVNFMSLRTKSRNKNTVASVKLQDYLGVSFMSNDVELIHLWKAHREPITDIQVIENPKSILSISLDFRVTIWSFEGHILGVLQQGRVERKTLEGRLASTLTNWKFECDVEEKKRYEKEEIDKVISLIKEHDLMKTSVPDLKTYINEEGEKTLEMDEELALSIDSDDLSVLADMEDEG